MSNEDPSIPLSFIHEQQQSIVESTSARIIVNGCAGSCKTDTGIKKMVHHIQTYHTPVLALTLVGSVTNELCKRMRDTLDVPIRQSGKSNHFLGMFQNTPFSISNFDAWIHLMIEDQPGVQEIAQCFSQKTMMLLRLTEEALEAREAGDETDGTDLRFLMKVSTRVVGGKGRKVDVGFLFIDEIQDMCSVKMKIIVNLCKLFPHLRVMVAGDILQTVFWDGRSVHRIDMEDDIPASVSDAHPMYLFRSVQPTYFQMNICMRCPRSHVALANYVMSQKQIKYGILPMESMPSNLLTPDKPVFFTHDKTTKNNEAMSVAREVVIMLDALMESDPSIVPDDVACIMGKSRNNVVFHQMSWQLRELYARRGFGENTVEIMSTEGDGWHTALNWAAAEGKTKLLSVTGDKGKGHKVVFFLGVSEYSIPQECQVYKPTEIIGESLLNVGLTRSTKYLFVGFNYRCPSRYLPWQHHEFKKLVYASWDPSSFVGCPEPYNSIMHRLNEHIATEQNEKVDREYLIPQLFDYRKMAKMTGTNSELSVKENISKVFEEASELFTPTGDARRWEAEPVIFGSRQALTRGVQYTNEHYCLIGNMAELMIQRLVMADHLLARFEDAVNGDNIQFTNDERFLTCMYDVNKIPFTDSNAFDEYIRHPYFAWKENLCLRSKIRSAFKTGKRVYHSVFERPEFQDQVEDFLDIRKTNRDLSCECWWNITLFYIQIGAEFYKPNHNSMFGFGILMPDITTLHNNVEAYKQNVLLVEDTILHFEKPLKVQACIYGPDKLELLQVRHSHTVAIRGKCDIYDKRRERLVEIKASTKQECSQQWISQGLCYSSLMQLFAHPVSRMCIVNILEGILWEWEIPDTLRTVESLIQGPIAEKYEWHNLEVDALVEYCGKIRNGEIVDLGLLV